MKTANLSLTIDIRQNIYSPKLYARKIWAALFKLVPVTEFNNLDSFLCDLYSFATMIEATHGEPITFYWSWDISGWTDVTTWDPKSEHSFKIEYTKDLITISKD